MANVFDSNPITLDSFVSDIDVGNSAFGLPNAPFFIKAIQFHDPTANDIIVLKNKRGEVVAQLEAFATNQDITRDFIGDPLMTQGLVMLTADQTVTTGTVLIYI